MMSMLEPHISIDTDYILVQDRVNIEYYKSKRTKVRPWSFGMHGYERIAIACADNGKGKSITAKGHIFGWAEL